ncbi:hypothetical protein Ddye_012185 [Dipteronia dyeriana]|uniref:Uncharacterized protein n=1 Tax=Dipteronia dyeriana TaxID=168575 RepID=A0AAE0CIB3_9ROSI|nr:hypothetical protein Ddye_012185 [Dipteronia dyeriana]
MQLHPRHFGHSLREHFVSKLMKDVEGTCRLDRQWPAWIVVAIMGHWERADSRWDWVCDVSSEVLVCCIQRGNLRSCFYYGQQGRV